MFVYLPVHLFQNLFYTQIELLKVSLGLRNYSLRCLELVAPAEHPKTAGNSVQGPMVQMSNLEILFQKCLMKKQSKDDSYKTSRK